MSGSLHGADAILAQAGPSSCGQAQATPEPAGDFTPELLRQRVLTLGDAVDVLPELDDVPQARKAGWINSARFFAKRLGLSCHDVRLDPVEMHERLRSCLITPARKLGAKRLSNVRSDLNGIATRMGWVIAYGGPNAHPLRDQRWIHLIEALTYSPQRSVVAGFARYCEGRTWSPHDVTPDALAGYADWRRANTYDTSIIKTVSAIRKLWNRSAQTIPGWPRVQFPTPGQHNQFRADLSEFPDSLIREIEAYGRDLLNPDLMEDHARKALSETTAKMWRDALLWSVTALSQDGHQLMELQSLSSVVTPDNLHAVLKARLSKSGGKWGSMARTIKSVFLDVAKRKLGLPPEQMSRLEATAAKVKSPKGRLSQKRTDDTLAITSDPKLVEAFMNLPWAIAKSADDLMAARRPVRAAEQHEIAVAIALLLESPMRRRAIVRLDARTHFARNQKGKAVAFRVPVELSKTGTRIDHPIQHRTAALLARHLTVFRPQLLLGAADTALFPSRVKGKPRSLIGFASRMKRVIEKVLKANFYLHLVRHVTAVLLLDDDPKNAVIAQRMLGHSTLETTEGIYGHLGTKAAHRAYGEAMRRQASRARGTS